MGSKIDERLNSNPGPGQYDADASKIRQDMGGSVRIGQAERTDVWMEQSRTDAPGPGNYTDETNTFGKAVMGGHMGTKLVEKLSSNPGPGQYESNDMITKT